MYSIGKCGFTLWQQLTGSLPLGLVYMGGDDELDAAPVVIR